jgi:hypothetical protein
MSAKRSSTEGHDPGDEDRRAIRIKQPKQPRGYSSPLEVVCPSCSARHGQPCVGQPEFHIARRWMEKYQR